QWGEGEARPRSLPHTPPAVAEGQHAERETPLAQERGAGTPLPEGRESLHLEGPGEESRRIVQGTGSRRPERDSRAGNGSARTSLRTALLGLLPIAPIPRLQSRLGRRAGASGRPTDYQPDVFCLWAL